MKGLDLSKFKKIDENDKSTTLKHPDGHTIIIAAGVLSPKLKEELKKLPKATMEKLPPEPGYTEPKKKMAEGGKVQHFDEGGGPIGASGDIAASAQPPQQNFTTVDSSGNQPQAPTEDMDPNSPAPVQDNSTPATADEDDSDDETDQSTQPEAPATAPEASSASAPGTPAAPAPLTPQQQVQNFSNEYQQTSTAIGNDIANGHITPQTYSSLFHNKDTLGKIGTIFGMLLSSAGSGMTHQPNMLMELMQKQIDNDFQAQKQNAANKQNFYSMYMQHQMNEANIAKTQADTLYQQAQASKIPAEKEQLLAQAREADARSKQMGITSQIDANTMGNITAMQAAWHSLATGPLSQTPEGQQTLGMMWPQFQKAITDKADAGAGAKYQAQLLSGLGGQQGGGDEQAFQNKMMALRMSGQEKLADDINSRHMSGIPGLASSPLSADDKERIESSQNLINDLQRLQDFSNKHNNISERENPVEWAKTKAYGQTLAENVKSSFQKAQLGGVFRQQEHAYIDNIVPDPTKFLPSITVTPKISSLIDEANSRNNLFLKQKGFPVQQQKNQPQQQSSGSQDPKIASYAKQYNLDYNTAKSVLSKRGYNP